MDTSMTTRKRMPMSALLDPKIIFPAVVSSFVKLDPRVQIKNPVMFVVELVAVLTTILFVRDLLHGGSANIGFTFQIILWLWITLLFANFSEAVAEGRGKAQAATLRRTRTETKAKLLSGKGIGDYKLVSANDLKVNDLVLIDTGDIIPSDGEIVEGIASVNEAAITGESAPVIRESGGDRSAVTGGTQILSDKIVVRITAAQGSTFLDRMISLVEGAERQKTPNEIALNILLAGLTITDAPCQAVCPVNCFFTTADGVVLHSKDLCIGCGYCFYACPFGAPQYPRVGNFGSRGKMDKCTFCAGGPEADGTSAEYAKYGANRLAQGKLPLCAEMCSTKSLLAGDGEIIAQIYKERVMKRGYGSGAWGWETAYHETIKV